MYSCSEFLYKYMAKINKEKQAAMPQKLLHELFDYNPATGGWVNKTNRGTKARKGQPAGSTRPDGYVQISINGYKCYAHRLAWIYIHGDYPSGEQPNIDHINGNPSDNRITNLRCSSDSENSKNLQMMSNNTSGVTGVYRYQKKNLSGKIYDYWAAYWYDETGKQCMKSFPIHTYGDGESKQMAIEYRAEQIHLLELNHGIIYTERHGKQKKGNHEKETNSNL